MTNTPVRTPPGAAAHTPFIQVEALTCDEQGRWLLVQPKATPDTWQLVGGPVGAFEELASALARHAKAQIDFELIAMRALLVNRDIEQQQIQTVVGTSNVYFDELRSLKAGGEVVALRFEFPQAARQYMEPVAFERASAAFRELNKSTTACAFTENGKSSIRPHVLA